MEPQETVDPPAGLAAQLGWVRELARALLGNGPDADDVAQEVWLRAASKSSSTAGNRAWLSVVTTRLVHGVRRSEARRRRREEVAARVEVGREDDVLARGETGQRLIGAVMALPEPYRSTVLHRYIDGLSVAEIAERENVTEPAVRKRLSRAIGQLRARLDKEFEGGRSTWIAALIDVVGRKESGALPLLAVAGVGLLIMKKALLVAGVLVLVCLSVLAATGRHWLGLDGEREHVADVAKIAASLPADPALDLPEPASETRASVAGPATASANTIVVEGAVVNLPYPDVSGAAEPAAGVVVTLRIPFIGSEPIPEVETVTGADGRFRLTVEAPAKLALHVNVYAAGDDTYRMKSASIQLDDMTGTFERRLERAAHGDLSGIVVDHADRPVPDTVVRLAQASAWLGPETVEGEAAPASPEVTTDASGQFTFRSLHASNSFHPGTPSLVVRKAGFRMLPSRPPSFRARGGWDDVQIRLLPSAGQLAVRVLDAQGVPQSDVGVAARISSGEPGASWEPWDRFPRKTDKTDADGRVVLEDLWLGRRLALSIQGSTGNWLCERAIGGRIDIGRPARGSGIVIPDSKTLALDVVLPATARITGRVVDGARTVVPAANVVLVMRGGDTHPDNRFSLKSDSEGRFETVIARPTRTLVIDVAGYTGTGRVWGSLDSLPPEPGRMVGRNVAEFDPASGAEPFVEIVVEPALSISGTVREADDTPCKGRVVAIPVGAPEGEYTRGAGTTIGEDGRFEIGSLVPGEYSLDVRPHEHDVFTDCLLSQRFDGIAAGRSDVELTLGQDRAVEVEVEVSATDGKPAEMTFVIGMFHPYGARDPSGYVPDSKQRYAGHSGWPNGATLNFGGQTGHVGPDGVTGFLHMYGELPVHRLAPMSEGWYALGLDARDAEGARYHACGTGLVYLRPGAYRFHFDLVRQANVEGRIVNADPDADLALMLVTSSGDPVQILRTDRHIDEIVSIGAEGRFQLTGAPLGAFRLRVGSEPELRRGIFLRETAVVVAPTGNAPLEITLP